MWFRNRKANQHVVDTSLLDRELQIAACRDALELVAPEVDRFQCDVPWVREQDWPVDVREAAAVLVPVHSGYQTSGWVRDFSENVWRAFVTFAPYAYASDAWTKDMKFLAEVNDEGSSLTVRVLPEQMRDFKRLVHGATVVPLNEWRRK
jgi:hypothetical protein